MAEQGPTYEKELGAGNDLSEVELKTSKSDDDSGLGRTSRFTIEEENAVIRKLDWHLMPLIFVLYSFSVLDRSNLGNAKIAGMSKDIDIAGNRYAWLGTIFYISCSYNSPYPNYHLS